ncbi:mechanosensitive ion channel family protein [Mesorhizobium sp. LHD-90]|uniref:mechanosensitive ion channel family protein n=1 Tax=Mesorhizobium sp. LHD-90 TaxID=3071414 RepID=UPI0027E0B47D|nr:mechanosensitive ion channel family protein [Mesorhizobium sp. LHD-90]MDQ6432582.1 mechanosensitive ion channel family protein [Mesorhizobium sp. LHD-90]
MTPGPVARFLLTIATVAIFLAVAGGVSLAQTQPVTAAPPPPEKVQQLLGLLNDPEVKAWLEARPAAPAAADTAAEDTVASGVSDFENRIRSHIGGLKNGLLNFPQELARASEVVAKDINSGSPGKVIGILAVLVAVGYGAEWLFRRLLRREKSERSVTAAADQPLRLLADLIPLLVFALASAGLFLVFQWPPLLRKAVLTVLLAFIVFRLIRTIAKLLLAPDGATAERPRMVDQDDAEAGFWFHRVQLLAGIFLVGWAIASLMPALSFSRGAMQLVGYVFGLGLLGVAIESVWRRPHFDTSSTPTRAWLVTFFLVILWLVWVSGMVGFLWLGLYALFLPRAVRGVGQAAETLAARNGSDTLLSRMTNVLVVRGARALVIALAVAWLAYIWEIRADAVGGNAVMDRLVGGLLHGVIILLIADLLWQLSKAFIAHRLEVTGQEGGTADEIARRGRLRTLLPIFRNVLAVFIGIVAVLTILSGMGVAIAPLVAGAGIFGVAIGFGSQTLVKDVISGVFFMLDDAFRVGEYIQSGSYKGTVEGFSLRSVRLRHQRGPIFTVPFGSLGAVQNMSRDWVIEKMTLTVTYDSDIEAARKIVKKIGQELAQDPEFADNTLQPLKMQGVDSFGDLGIVLRMKLMTKPGQQFGIKRRALVMIKKAFDEAGIKLATPMVQVSGGGDDAAAAAARETLRRKAVEEAAAAASA